MIPIEHSRAVQMATWVVVAEKARATTRATDIRIAMPPRLKRDTRPQSWRRDTCSFRRRKKGRMKTRLVRGLR